MTPPPNGITIRHLADVPSARRVLVQWFVEEWAPYYGPDGPGDAEATSGARPRIVKIGKQEIELGGFALLMMLGAIHLPTVIYSGNPTLTTFSAV